MEFSMKEIIALLTKRFVLIALCTLAGLATFFIINRYVTKPSYTASVQMYVSSTETATTANLNELNYAQKVVTTYINFLQTKVFYKQVIEESHMNYTQAQLKKMTTIQSVNNTEIFQISVTSYDPEDSYQLVAAMQIVAPKLIKNIKNTADISVVDPVVFSTIPTGPNIILNTFLGGIIGFLLSVLALFLWEMVDVNVKNQEDLIKKYQIPILGTIPNYELHQKRSYLLSKLNPFHHKHRKQVRIDKLINEDTKFILSEAYKALRTNLRYTLRREGCKKVLFNSPIPEEGKSTTCTNVGITIAQTGARVLILDCDLRKGRLHIFYNIKSTPGISDILSGMYNEKDAIQDTAYANLQVITMGAIPPNPTELLASTQMEELLKKLEKNYDYILIDSPPVNVVSDALSLVKLVDGVVIVVRENITSHPNIANAITKYQFVETKILGFVLNGVSMTQGNKSKSKYYAYYNSNKHD